jgi:hypothetical protein
MANGVPIFSQPEHKQSVLQTFISRPGREIEIKSAGKLAHSGEL